MSHASDFDPYYKWLGIPPQHQPPDHYRLLGLEALESDRDVIRAAAERQRVFIQAYKIGSHSELSQKLLNELAQAKLCLLDPARKAAYDRSLPAAVAPPKVAIAVPLSAVQALPPPLDDDPQAILGRLATAGTGRSSKSLRRKRRLSWGPALVICAIGLLISGAAIVLLKPEPRPLAEPPESGPPVVAPGDRPIKSKPAVLPTEPKRLIRARPESKAPAPNGGAIGGNGNNPLAAAAEKPPVTVAPMPNNLPPPPVQGLRLPGGRELLARHIRPPSLDSIKQLFPERGPPDLNIFVLKQAPGGAPEGLFTFNQQKEFDGPALVAHPSGRPKVLLNYAKNHRTGMLHNWNEVGVLEFFSMYNNRGDRDGLTCLCEAGLPLMIEMWDERQKPKAYLIEVRDGVAQVTDEAAADKIQLAKLADAQSRLRQLEVELTRAEGQWKPRFRRWWDDSRDAIERANRSLARAEDSSEKLDRQSKLTQILGDIQRETREGMSALLPSLRPLNDTTPNWVREGAEHDLPRAELQSANPTKADSKPPSTRGGAKRNAARNQPLLTRLQATQWKNSAGDLFVWDANGNLLLNGHRRDFGIDDDRTVRIVFQPEHVDTLVFDDAFQRFEQFSSRAPQESPLHTGWRAP